MELLHPEQRRLLVHPIGPAAGVGSTGCSSPVGALVIPSGTGRPPEAGAEQLPEGDQGAGIERSSRGDGIRGGQAQGRSPTPDLHLRGRAAGM